MDILLAPIFEKISAIMGLCQHVILETFCQLSYANEEEYFVHNLIDFTLCSF